MSYTIITHDGKAHLDDLLAAALLALYRDEEPEAVIRMDAQEAAAVAASGDFSEDTWFIDCGLIFNRERNLFDHHQDKNLDSSALLVFDEYFPYLKDTELHGFIKLVSRVDTKGAMSLDDFDGIGESRDYFSFGQDVLLRTFEEDPGLVLKLLVPRLKERISFEDARKEATLWLDIPENREIVQIESVQVFRYLKKPPGEIKSPLKTELKKLSEESEISSIFSFDDKIDRARILYRTDFGHQKLDFSRCRPSNPVFCHQSGFLLKFIPADDEEWIRLINESLIRSLS